MLLVKPHEILIALDDGHGEETAGKRTPKFEDGSFMKENLFNSAVVDKIDKKLKYLGFNTLLVAPTDSDVPLAERVAKANDHKADAYISIHANALKGYWGDWGGIETYSHPNSIRGKELAGKIHNRLLEGTRLRDRGLKEATFYVLRKTTMPSILAECAFMDNKKEAKLLMSEEYREETAKEVVQGICDYFSVEYKEERGEVTMDNKDVLVINGDKYIKVDNIVNYLEKLEGEILDIADKEPKPTVPNEPKEYLTVTPSALNVRDNKKGNKVGVVRRGDVLEKLGTHPDGDWYKIKKGSLVGYVHGGYVVKKKSLSKGYRKIRKFDSDVHIYETSLDEETDVELGEYGKFEKLSEINKEGIVVSAKINCGFFGGGNEHLGTYVDEGLYYKDPSDTFLDLIYYKDGTTEIKNVENLSEVARLQPKTKWVIGTSWSLMQDGEINLENSDKISHSAWRNPRTMLGQKPDGTFVLVVVDGRNKDSKGVTAKQSAEIVRDLGCYNAVNLDGGGSSEMIVGDDIMNTPSDGHERNIGSAILVYEQ